MSRWLQNVGQFLENLDDKAEKVAEDVTMKKQHEFLQDEEHDLDVASILAARGLATTTTKLENVSSGDDQEEQEQLEETVEVTQEGTSLDHADDETPSSEAVHSVVVEEAVQPSPQDDADTAVSIHADNSVQSHSQTSTEEQEQIDPPPSSSSLQTTEPSQSPSSAEADQEEITTDDSDSAGRLKGGDDFTATGSMTATADTTKATVSASSSSSPSPSHRLLADSQKEVRTLRRHVVSLNKQLETAESEIVAQRQELERAGERLEKDSVRYKKECEKLKTMHATEFMSLQNQHEISLKESKERSDRQVQDMRDQLRSLEQRRMQEGGDMNQELEDALAREQEAIIKLASLEDENGTLLSHIATLNAQQENLSSRLESLTETADNALDRERDADNRLDEALSAHARQISQRQSRESELERTIAELGAALVAARNSTSTSISSYTNIDNSRNGTSMDANVEGSSPDMKLVGLLSELDTVRTQLDDEQQRNMTLQEELHQLSRERTEESSIAQSRQRKQDQKVADLSQTISRLNSELRDVQRNSIRESAMGDRNGDEEDFRRIKDLSEEVLRLREKMSSSNSEVSALKSRLQVALDRANRAETAMEEWRENASIDASDVEVAAAGGAGMRRRGGRRGGGARETRTPTIRSALSLDSGVQGERTERIGKSLDALDTFLTQSGRFLRYNPLARLLFIVYLLVLHLWTFLLLFFHAHGFETIHGDFGAGGTLSHGPNALMQAAQLQAVLEQQPIAVKSDGIN